MIRTIENGNFEKQKKMLEALKINVNLDTIDVNDKIYTQKILKKIMSSWLNSTEISL